MSEQSKSRSVEEINAEYSSLCTQLGDRYTKKLGLEAEMASIHARVSELGLEMQALLKAQEEAKVASIQEVPAVVEVK